MKQLAMILACMILMGILPASVRADGLGIRIESDRQQYETDDTARISIYIENKTGKKVRNINVLHHLPDGLIYTGEADVSKTVIPELADGESTVIHIEVRKEQPKVAVHIHTDKNMYKDSDVAELTVTIENTSNTPIKNLELSHILPNGLMYDRNSGGQMHVVDELGAHEVAEVKLYVKKAALPPETGDQNLPVLIWMFFAMTAVATAVYLAKKKGEA